MSTTQHLAGAVPVLEPKTSPESTLRFNPFNATFVACFNSRERYSTPRFSIRRIAVIIMLNIKIRSFGQARFWPRAYSAPETKSPEAKTAVL